MPTNSDINSCLSIQDPIEQLNCIRTAYGYPIVTATSSTEPVCDGYTISGQCISKNAILIGVAGVFAIFFLTRK